MDFSRIAERITDPYSLGAYGIAAVVYILLRRRGTVPAAAWIAIIALALIPVSAAVVIELFRPPGVYTVRAVVLNTDGIPVDGATFTCSAPCGEPKAIKGGAEFTIPSALKPSDGKLIIYATLSRDHLSGQGALTLAGDHNPSVKIQLARIDSAEIRGRVQDDAGNAISEASVSVAGYPAILTGRAGEFILQTHTAIGEEVKVTAEKAGYLADWQKRLAGERDVTLVLRRK